MDFSLFRRKQEPPEEKASASGPLIHWATPGRVAWSPRDTVTLTKVGFLGNPIGFRCAKLIAETAAAIPLVVGDGRVQFEAHPVSDLVARPNPFQASAEFLEALYGQLVLSGDGYVEAVADAGALPHELHVLRSDRMNLVPGADGWPVAYEYSVSGRKHRYAVEAGASPVCHVKAFHPQDDHYGLSPLSAAATAIDVHNAASRWSKALLDNAARPSGAIVMRSNDGSATLSADQYERLISEMETFHQGARNAGRPMLLEGGLDWKPMAFTPSDMEFQKSKESAAREIAVAFGVPPMILGIPGDATYANYQEANRAFYRLTVLPLVRKVTGALGFWLSEFAGETVSIRPNLDEVQALASERDALWRRVSEAAFLSDGEKRQMLGLGAPANDEGNA